MFIFLRKQFNFLIPAVAAAALLTVTAPTANATIIIDAFSTSSNATVMLLTDVPPGAPAYFGPAGVATAGAIGGARMMASFVMAGQEEDLYRFRVSNPTGLASIETSALISGKGVLTYNGTTTPNTSVVAGNFTAPSNFNLGGIDITEGGMNQAVFVKGYADNNGIPIVFTFWVNASTYARGVLNLPGSSNGVLLPHHLDFTNFVATGNTLHNILIDVRAITIELDGAAPGVSVGTDVVLDYVIAAAIPEPGTYILIGSALLGLGFIRRRATAV